MDHDDNPDRAVMLIQKGHHDAEQTRVDALDKVSMHGSEYNPAEDCSPRSADIIPQTPVNDAPEKQFFGNRPYDADCCQLNERARGRDRTLQAVVRLTFNRQPGSQHIDDCAQARGKEDHHNILAKGRLIWHEQAVGPAFMHPFSLVTPEQEQADQTEQEILNPQYDQRVPFKYPYIIDGIICKEKDDGERRICDEDGNAEIDQQRIRDPPDLINR